MRGTSLQALSNCCWRRAPSLKLVGFLQRPHLPVHDLPRSQRVRNDLLPVEVDACAEQGTLLVRTAGVDTKSLSESPNAARFVNMAEEREARLMPVDRRSHRLASNRHKDMPGVFWSEILVQLGGLVQP